MAVEAILQLITIPAGADLSSNQFCTVFVDTDGTAKLAAEDKNADGILQNNPKQTEACAVAVFGISKAKIGDNVTVGQALEVGTNGTLVPYNDGPVVAKALEAGANGNIVTVLLFSGAKAYGAYA